MKTADAVKPRARPRAKRIASTGGRFRISDELWALVEPLLPKHQNTHRFGGGRPRVPDRPCAEALFFDRKADRYLGRLHFVCGLIAYRAADFFGLASILQL